MKKTAAGTYRYGFNGKENDNEVKGEGNQQDYGMRIYDPRVGGFLSVDPITKSYPMLTPYQFASNRPIDGIDLDGLEWAEYARPYAIERNNREIMSPEQYKRWHDRGTKIGFLTVTGVLTLGYGTAALATGGTLYSLTGAALWMGNPSNQLLISSALGFTFNVLNPDPNGSPVDFPGVGDELGRSVNLLLKTNAGKTVQFIAEKGAKFANTSEWKWAQQLLNEGNNVRVMKDIQSNGVTNGDLFVNGVNTEIKELSKMTLGDNFVRNLTNKFKDALDQASNVIIDGTKQKGFTMEAAQDALSSVKRKGVAKDATFRIVGNGFDFTETIKAKEKNP